jgi:hypothetical protein
MLYSFDVLHFEEKAEKLVKIVAEGCILFNALRLSLSKLKKILVGANFFTCFFFTIDTASMT